MSIEQTLAAGVSAAVKALYGADTDAGAIQLAPTRKEFEGDLTVVVFPWVKAARKAPAAVAAEIGEWLLSNVPEVAAVNAVNGFLNISVSRGHWPQLLQQMAADDSWGIRHAGKDAPLVMVEYSSPNTNKPLHLGHLRNILLGYSLSKILAAGGNRVVKTNIVNDRGIHICKSMLAWQKWGEGCTPESTGK